MGKFLESEKPIKRNSKSVRHIFLTRHVQKEFIMASLALFVCRLNPQNKTLFQKFESQHSYTLPNTASNGIMGKTESQVITFVVPRFVV